MASDIDIVTLAEAKRATNLMSSTNHDDQLATFVTGISERIDALCGFVVARNITEEQHDGGKTRIWLRKTPALSVTTITEYRHTTGTTLTEETNANKPANGYLLDHIDLLSYIWRRTSGSDAMFPAGRRNVVVTYQAGRYANTAAVSDQFTVAVESILRRVWKREQGSWAQSPNYFSGAEDPQAGDRFRGFFRAYDPMIKEQLEDQLLPPAGA